MSEYVLPLPPSTNTLYSGRRFKTAAYKAWIERAGWELKLQNPRPIVGRYRMTLWYPGKADLDNIKPVGDLFQRLGTVENDRLMDELHVFRAPGECRILIEPLEGAP